MLFVGSVGISTIQALHERVLENPHEPEHRVQLAELYMRQGHLDEALTHYRAAGHTYLRIDQPEQARKVFVLVLHLVPDDDIARRGLGMAKEACAQQLRGATVILSSPERRHSPRIPWYVPVVVRGQDFEWEGIVQDVSATGMYVACPKLDVGQAALPGAQVELDFDFPTPGPNTGTGRITHIGEREPFGFGLVLSALSDDALQAIIDRIALFH